MKWYFLAESLPDMYNASYYQLRQFYTVFLLPAVIFSLLAEAISMQARDFGVRVCLVPSGGDAWLN